MKTFKQCFKEACRSLDYNGSSELSYKTPTAVFGKACELYAKEFMRSNGWKIPDLAIRVHRVYTSGNWEGTIDDIIPREVIDSGYRRYLTEPQLSVLKDGRYSHLYFDFFAIKDKRLWFVDVKGTRDLKRNWFPYGHGDKAEKCRELERAGLLLFVFVKVNIEGKAVDVQIRSPTKTP